MRPGTALVTGAARRLGRAAALSLAERGWRVVVHYNRSRDEAEATLAELRGHGVEALGLACDLAQPDEARALVGRCAEQGFAPDLLVNNASLFSYDSAETLDAASWDRHQRINALAPALLSQAFAAGLGEAQEGCIVNLLDNKVFNLNPDFFSYTVSKFALFGMTQMHALTFAPRVRVNAIAPGVTLISGKQTQESFERSQRYNPLGRGAEPEDVVRALHFILDTPCLTGQVLTLDGGQSLVPQPRDVAFLTGTPPPGGRRT